MEQEYVPQVGHWVEYTRTDMGHRGEKWRGEVIKVDKIKKKARVKFHEQRFIQWYKFSKLERV